MLQKNNIHVMTEPELKIVIPIEEYIKAMICSEFEVKKELRDIKNEFRYAGRMSNNF